ncbi:MAG: Uma2 family endonuclease [Bryobacteraceae bacterium]
MASTTTVSLEEYLHSVYEPDAEYLDGEVVERSVGETDHGGVQGILVTWLRNRRKQLGIHVFPETRTQVAPRRFRVPDIAVTLKKPSGRVLVEPPLLCIEILSPEDRASRMEARIDDYFAFGVPYVWVIDPRGRRAWSYTRDRKREAADLLTTDEPRIELRMEEIFAELDEEIEAE